MKISVLVSARKNSKFLAKFMFGYINNTTDHMNTEILVMLNKGDTWNLDLVKFYEGRRNVKFFFEDYGYGRAGLHEYFNELAQKATGDMLIYFCEDHYISYKGWDIQTRRLANANFDNPRDVWLILGKFDNIAGPMNQVFSRGYLETLGYLGRNGWIDSYVNAICEKLPRDRYVEMPVPLFHDFTHDRPPVLDDVNTKTEIKEEKLPYDHDQTRAWLAEDIDKLNEAIRSGKR